VVPREAQKVLDQVPVVVAGGVESISLVQPKLNTNDYTEAWLMVHKPELWMPMLQTAEIVAEALSAKKKLEESVMATSDWQPTGKIDFFCAETPKDDKSPAAFLLRVEDCRTVESISGVEHTEIRWRNAALAEAKSVVVAHQNATDTGTKGYQIPRLVRT
jgi:hypothetical protein